MQLIYSVDKVQIIRLHIDAPLFFVVATGRTTTTGWTNPQLGAWYYLTPPADGIQDFDFYAEEPTAPITLPLLTPIVAVQRIGRGIDDYWGPGKPLRGIGIHARTNSVEVPIEAHEKLDFAGSPGLEGGDLPFPFPQAFIGMRLRVYKTGDAITKEFVPDRLNIELNPQTQRIVAVWRG